ncbi:MAG: flagellar hook-basal body complex protein FliE [Rickettsiales bacterium]|nr:flagellar hook-basal body complex protein FliE [Rickettsiales bacterium]
MADTLTAVNAYRNQMKMMENATKGVGAEDETGKPSFASLVEQAIGGAAESVQSSEALQAQALTTGKVELSDLVTAVASAELSLNTVVAVRDRVINAYNDIIRMAI